MKESITARVLGRMYMRRVEYLAELERLVQSSGYKRVPKHLQTYFKEQAWETVRNNETLDLE